jgi:hypothetical protein
MEVVDPRRQFEEIRCARKEYLYGRPLGALASDMI